MRVDIGNALDEVATPGVSTEALDRLDEAVATAHETIAAGMSNAAFGYASLNLPETTSAAGIERAVANVDADAVVTVGIGGSALGAKTVSAALGEPNHHVLDNVDPEATTRLLNSLELARTAVNVVSRSGTTAETLANFLVTPTRLPASTGPTGRSSPLARRARWPTWPTKRDSRRSPFPRVSQAGSRRCRPSGSFPRPSWATISRPFLRAHARRALGSRAASTTVRPTPTVRSRRRWSDAAPTSTR